MKAHKKPLSNKTPNLLLIASYIFITLSLLLLAKYIIDPIEPTNISNSSQTALPNDSRAQNNQLSTPASLPAQSPKTAYVSVVVSNLGLDSSLLKQAFSLPNTVSLGFSPYTPNLTAELSKAFALGYGTMVEIPMQSKRYPFDNLGPYCLLDNLSEQENSDRINWILSRAENIFGVYTNSTEVFTQSAANLKLLLNNLDVNAKKFDQSSFVYLYYDPENTSQIPEVKSSLKSIKTQPKEINAYLRDVNNSQETFKYIETFAKTEGSAVLVVEAKSAILTKLFNWLENINETGIKLISLNTLKRIS